MLSVDQLVPLPIVGKLHEVVVSELYAGVGGFHRVVPGHRLIVAGARAKRVPHPTVRILWKID